MLENLKCYPENSQDFATVSWIPVWIKRISWCWQADHFIAANIANLTKQLNLVLLKNYDFQNGFVGMN
jgi:hypothetical protein